MKHVVGIKPIVWVPVLVVTLTAIIGWGAWATVTAMGATPREVFDEHVNKVDEKFDRMQQSIDTKVQKLIDHLIEGE